MANHLNKHYNSRMQTDWQTIPLSLYIHVPWCERKCPYCDFNSHQSKSAVNESAYIQQVINDLDQDIKDFGPCITDRSIKTIFVGGGTPSLFSAESYATLFDEIRKRLHLERNAEITLEANPGSSEACKFLGFRDAGINRLSIGVQSFNQEHLTALGRVHSNNEAIDAAGFARQAGFDNFNLDLMFGLPSQNIEQACDDLKQAIALKPTHLSCYQLTIEPNTLFHHRPPVTPSDELLWDMQEALQAELAKAEYLQYEVSAYAKAQRQCQHNLNYWGFGDYLGIGAGAHGKISTHHGIVRRWKIKHPTSYLTKSNKIGSTDSIEGADITFEFMLNALRLNNGFDVREFEQRTGQSLDQINELLHKHIDLGLMKQSSNRIKPTEFGHNMLNNILEDYLYAAQASRSADLAD